MPALPHWFGPWGLGGIASAELPTKERTPRVQPDDHEGDAEGDAGEESHSKANRAVVTCSL